MKRPSVQDLKVTIMELLTAPAALDVGVARSTFECMPGVFETRLRAALVELYLDNRITKSPVGGIWRGSVYKAVTS